MPTSTNGPLRPSSPRRTSRPARRSTITPQFLAQVDVTGCAPGADTFAGACKLARRISGERSGAAERFSVLDAILLRLAIASRFPALREIVVAGHSAGGQLVQRYAIVGRAPAAVASATLAVRFVVANPSSYLYFTPERPAGSGFAPFDAAACPEFNRWKYGIEAPPPYVAGNVADLESRYLDTRRHAICSACWTSIRTIRYSINRARPRRKAPYRLARGLAYVRYLEMRHPGGTRQSLAEVAGVDHDALGMFASSCGLAVLFDTAEERVCDGSRRRALSSRYSPRSGRRS